MYRRIVIFGNSGAGKSTLAKALAGKRSFAHLDLDTLAWRKDTPTVRRDLAASEAEMMAFFDAHDAWVVEGCYADLLAVALERADRCLFLNPGADVCVEHCRQRPWEPHKYASKEAQDANLPMLIEWVRQYETREDEFSLQAHQALFDDFTGSKQMFREPVQADAMS